MYFHLLLCNTYSVINLSFTFLVQFSHLVVSNFFCDPWTAALQASLSITSKASRFKHSVFFIVQLSHPYTTTGKAIALTIWTIALTISNWNRTAHLQKIGLEIYWAWPHPSEQDPVSSTVSLSHQEASISLLPLSLRGQTDWKPQSHKTNQTAHVDHSLV